MKLYKLLLIIASFCCIANVSAATYYVNATNGNDQWSGTSPTVSTNNGPWQSVSKVNNMILVPGDKVLFSCGQTWYETLKPISNGSATADIYFGSYPSGCADKPKFSGLLTAQSYNWQPYKGNIWKTTFPQSLINNGNISSSIANWRKWPTDATQAFVSSCPVSVSGCMNFLASANKSVSVTSSNSFPLIGGQKYTAQIIFYAPPDTVISMVVRENGNTYSPVGLFKKGIIGNGNWQSVKVEFAAARTISNARLDIEVPKSKRFYLDYANVQLLGVPSKPSMVFFDSDPVTIAHHPNAGHDGSKPDSVYLSTSAASPSFKDTVGRMVSSKIMTSDLKLPSGINIGIGTKLRLRENNWLINEYAVTAASANALSISPNTLYPISTAGWGFYFIDELWMLDSAGEWFFDDTTKALYIWTPTNEQPTNKVALATLGTAIDLSAKSNLTIENLEIDGAFTGLDIKKSEHINLQHLNIQNINDIGINAVSSKTPLITTNRLNKIGNNGIYAIYSTNAIIEKNNLTEIGVFRKGGKRISLPIVSDTAIYGGAGAIINDNILADTGRFGVRTQNDSEVASNVVQRSCANFNDCGAIYLHDSAPRTIIKNNLIDEVIGDMDGTGIGRNLQVNGIYLDKGISGIKIVDNTVKGATNGIIIHGNSNTTISGNTLYGSEKSLIYQQEEINQPGLISGNLITKNHFFPTNNQPSIYNFSDTYKVSKFATYTDNFYSTVNSPYIVSEYEINKFTDYSFLDWQTAKTDSGSLRNNDLNGEMAAPLTSFAQGLTQNSFVYNGDFAKGLVGWNIWNSISPFAQNNLEGCLPVSTNCMKVNGGAEKTAVFTSSFSITKSKYYRVTFDLKASINNQLLYSIIRVAGPKIYSNLLKTPYRFTTTTSWKRHSFVFQAIDSATQPEIADHGARFDFEGRYQGQSIWIANLEIAPFDPGVFGPSTSSMLVNSSDVYKIVDCPTRSNNPGLCSNFVTYPEGTVTIWPLSVPPRSGKIVFSQNLNLLDSDGDSIADSQDKCPQTTKGQTVNGSGCSLTD
jgi:parallel beta-helix repeat protein